MSMTREQAIKHIEDIRASALENLGAKYAYGCEGYYRTRIELSDICLTALRPVSRERVKRAWKGCPECEPTCGSCVHMGAWDKHGKPYICEQCVNCSNFESDQKFCEVCGAPMTDEAVEMVTERMNKLYD